MKKKLFWLQLAALGVLVLSVAVLGILIFSRHGMENLTLIYVFAGLALLGFWGNAGAAAARVLWERNNRK